VTSVTFHGGVNEIGGNKILIEDKGTKILLDFGMSYGERAKFYSEPWLSPRGENGLLEFGILPNVPGIYRFEDSKPSVDAFFLSHAHTDHYKYVSFLKREIPMYCGETTKILLDVFSETRPKDFEHDLSGIKWNTFKTSDKIKVDSIEVEPVHVDHSIPAAYGFLVHTSSGTIVYTGDFRKHGTKSEMTNDFVEATRKAKPEVLLCEGTNLGRGEIVGEEEVRRKISAIIDSSSGVVLAGFSMADVDRLRTFHEAASENGRILAISLKQAYMLKHLKNANRIKVPDVENDSNIVIYRKEKKRYYKWEEEMFKLSNVKDAEDIGKKQSKFILVSLFSDLNSLIEIRPEPGSCYLYSSSEPHNEEMEIEFDKFQNWLDHFALPMYHAHASGHIMPNDLRQVISIIKPRKIIPMHTERAEMFSRWCGDVTQFIVPEKGIPLQFE
jgi:ribonuclease J